MTNSKSKLHLRPPCSFK